MLKNFSLAVASSSSGCKSRISCKRIAFNNNRNVSHLIQGSSIGTINSNISSSNNNSSSGSNMVINSYNRSQIRHFGITDSIMDFANSKMEKSKDEAFAKMIANMSESPKWTLKDWKDTFESQLSGWKMYIPGVSSSAGVQELKEFKVMLDSMSLDELEDLGKVTGIVKIRVSKDTGKSVDEVNRLIYFYKQSLVIATWLRMKKVKGEVLPTTQGEMLKLQETDIRIRDVARDVLQPKYKKSGRGRQSRLPF